MIVKERCLNHNLAKRGTITGDRIYIRKKDAVCSEDENDIICPKYVIIFWTSSGWIVCDSFDDRETRDARFEELLNEVPFVYVIAIGETLSIISISQVNDQWFNEPPPNIYDHYMGERTCKIWKI